MKKTIYFTLLLFLFVGCQAKEKEIKVLQFNIWHEGTSVEGGFEAIVNEIDRLNPEFVLFSEVRNYNDTRFCDRIVHSLAEKNQTYYSFYSDDTGLLSRYPITDSVKVMPQEGLAGGTIYKLIAKSPKAEFAVYSAHLNYRHYACYLPRGYDGYSWEKMEQPVTDVDSILTSNLISQRTAALEVFDKDAKEEIQKGRIVIIGGDFNEPSHLDWTDSTKDLYDHRGCVVPWHSTLFLQQEGYVDCYRQLYPDPLTHPGFTYPADCPQADIKKLAWAPDADDRDRIDFVFYYPDKRLKLKDCVIVGPKGSIVRNQRVPEESQDRFIEPLDVWPTDHKAVLATFLLK